MPNPASSNKLSHFQRLFQLMLDDSRELLGITIYALLNSLLLLAVPLAAQGLVNVTAAGLAVQPLVVLACALMIGLLFAGLLTCLRYMVAEVILERIFCRVALRVAEKLPTVRSSHLLRSGGPELMNRFFDVINIQKSWFKLIYDVPGAVLEIVLGLTLLAFYGIELFVGAAVFMVGGGLFVALAGMGGLKSSLANSVEKYRVVEWLEEMVRCQDSLRLGCRPEFWAEQADERVVSYLNTRRAHFRVLLRQVLLHYVVMAVSLAGMLGFGGYMVLLGKLSLGQLVAAELVIWSLLKAAEKLLRASEAYFSLLTGLDKVAYITDLPTESLGTASLGESTAAVKVTVDEVTYGYPPKASPFIRGLSLEIQPGERVAVLGPTGAGKSTVLRLLGGFLHPQEGSIELDQVDLRELSARGKSEAIGFLSERNELFAGSVLENVATGRSCDLHRAKELLIQTGGRGALRRAFGGDLGSLTSAGSILSAGEQKSILLSRALVGNPRLLLLDDELGSLCERSIETIVEKVYMAEDRPTIVGSSALPQIVAVCDKVLIMEQGVLVEQGEPLILARDPDSRFRALYPTLTKILIAMSGAEETYHA